MRQFYFVQAELNEVSSFNFVQPVRKICIVSDANISVTLSYSDRSQSQPMKVFAKTPYYLDFQTANNGGGLSSLNVQAIGTAGGVYVSVVEYGTGGNIDWYK